MSKSLVGVEKNYLITDLECLAIVRRIEHFHKFLIGRKFKIITDHAALKGLMNAKILKGRKARWVIELQQYDFEVIHRNGKENKNADALSRLKYEKGEKTKKELLKRLRLKKEPQVIIIDRVDGIGKSTVIENIVKDLEQEGKKIVFNKFKRRRQDDKRFEKPDKKYEWLFRKQVVEEINRRIMEYRDEDIIILDKSPYCEYFYQQTKSFDRGLITPYGNHKMEEEIFKYKDIIDNAIVVFLENNRCWENYIGRESKKGDEGHKTSYETLNEESYREMVEKFQVNQHLYEDVEKYKKVEIENDKEKEKYILRDDKLYRVNKGKEQLIIKRYEFEGLLYMMHNHELSGYFGINTTYEKIKDKYYWKNMFEDIKTYVKTCDRCQRKEKPDKKNELFLIRVKRESFYQIGIDFVEPLPATERNNRYIIIAIDYFTKWPEAKATEKDNAETVAEFIYEEIILERFNRTLCEVLAKLGGSNEWDKKIAPVLFAYRNRKHNSSKVKLFYLTYRREARLLTDEPNEKEDESRIDQLLIELPNMRLKAENKIEESQKKQKDYYDKKNSKRETYQIGNKVLKYNTSKEKQ
ncbi:putative integrase core domain protein [Rhizophagus clarus]|uniref:Putative integrase core domain protein n=1 Tax=Rhizophagus clarus TaxID=94130 RepID=A0A8H3MHB3_9GLOM|nr:putative integrase core domain protein [Rhizophagus clarus]